jgi:hypothetical protein
VYSFTPHEGCQLDFDLTHAHEDGYGDISIRQTGLCSPEMPLLNGNSVT